MSGAHGRPPGWLRQLFVRLLPGARGREVLEELDREYAARRRTRPEPLAIGWYVLQLLRPDTWRLARALRRIGDSRQGAGGHTIPEHHERRQRPTRRGPRASGLSLDLRLAWRMLVKSPGLSVVGVLGLAVGIAIGTGAFVALSNLVDPDLQLEEGDRIVSLVNRDVDANRNARHLLHDFFVWRDQLRSVEPIAAASIGNRALVTGDAAPRFVSAAEMTASGFEVARVPPLLGRVLFPDDEVEGAQPVAVLGHDLWRTRFGGDADVIGRSVLLGAVQHTVVGVMPPGFAFPTNQEVWTALRQSPERFERGAGPELFVFGRLAPGVTLERAQAELTTLGGRAAAAFPESHARLRPRVMPYTRAFDEIQDLTLWHAARMQLLVNLLLVAIAVNMAVLVYARTAMRQGEIALRSALGASRRRVVVQLSAEAFLLSSLAAVLGLGLAHRVLLHAQTVLEQVGGIEFWIDYGLQPRSVAYAVGLAIPSALIVGVLPALKATGRGLETDLRRLGGGASVRLGRLWTALIVAQVVVAVTVLPAAVHIGFREMRFAAMRATFPAHEFLSADLGVAVPLRPDMDGEAYRRAAAARLALRLPELERRLEAEPAVAGVTFEGRLPGRTDTEVDGAAGNGQQGARGPLSIGVAPDYFDVLGARILAGRGFRASDAGEAGGLVVSQAFVRSFLDGENALGRRVRFVAAPGAGMPAQETLAGPWLEIVGVVEDLHASAFDRELAPPFIYYAVRPGDLPSVTVLVHARAGEAAAVAPGLRQITTALDPDLRLDSVENLATVRNPRYLALVVTVLQFVLATVLLLSAAGIHALMSLTVTRRRREIGVRTALGAIPGRLLASIFSRAARQLGLGGLAGACLGGFLLFGGGLGLREATIYLGGVLVLMLAAGLMATLGPARRGLRVQPMDALREE